MKKIVVLIFLLKAISLFSQDNRSFEGRIAKSFDPVYAPFYHGVASGDALTDRVIIWTRVTPPCQVDSIQVDWFFGTDTACTQVEKQGTF
jgi:alkaline phosphatase D